jgi:Fe-S oxidoreductase
MARFKSEFLAGYHTRHGTPLGARVLGHIHEVSRVASLLAPVSNWALQAPPVRWLNEQLLGLDRRRIPPPWSRTTFAAAFGARRGRRAARDAPADVLLFNDTFTNFYHPDIGTAGADVLEAAGITVGLAPAGCCGRPLISQGLLRQARDRAAANANALDRAAPHDQPLVFFEPSCLSAVREDAPSLLRGELRDKALRVAGRSVLFEDLLEQRWRADKITLGLRPGPDTILLHGHCHQKAMGLVAPTRALLSRIPGAHVVDLDAGCCGMAGSFGYVRGHFDVSRTIAERRLLPAARQQKPGSVLVAPGTSCRSQVEDFAGLKPLHPAELLRALLPESL